MGQGGNLLHHRLKDNIGVTARISNTIENAGLYGNMDFRFCCPCVKLNDYKVAVGKNKNTDLFLVRQDVRTSETSKSWYIPEN